MNGRLPSRLSGEDASTRGMSFNTARQSSQEWPGIIVSHSLACNSILAHNRVQSALWREAKADSTGSQSGIRSSILAVSSCPTSVYREILKFSAPQVEPSLLCNTLHLRHNARRWWFQPKWRLLSPQSCVLLLPVGLAERMAERWQVWGRRRG